MKKSAGVNHQISVFSGIFLGLGVLFLSLSDKQANYATSILFGSIVGIDAANLRDLVCLSIFLLILIFFTFRKLAFNSFDAQGSEYNQRYIQADFDSLPHNACVDRQHYGANYWRVADFRSAYDSGIRI